MSKSDRTAVLFTDFQPFKRTIMKQIPIAAYLISLCMCLSAAATTAAEKDFEPVSGQAGKDVVWVPTPPSLVEKMLDLAKVTPRDFVMDLGSGDGRNIIAAARRGARAVGVEFNPEMVEYSNRQAEKAGVAGKAQFVQGDMFEADISQASVLALFLLPDNLTRLVPKFADLKPGSRIVLNTFGIPGWEPDQTAQAESECGAWCSALLYIVPAKVAGEWEFAKGRLKLQQTHQLLSGSYEVNGATVAVSDASLSGERIRFRVNGTEYTGTVKGDTIEGQPSASSGAPWTARRVGS